MGEKLSERLRDFLLGYGEASNIEVEKMVDDVEPLENQILQKDEDGERLFAEKVALESRCAALEEQVKDAKVQARIDMDHRLMYQKQKSDAEAELEKVKMLRGLEFEQLVTANGIIASLMAKLREECRTLCGATEDSSDEACRECWKTKLEAEVKRLNEICDVCIQRNRDEYDRLVKARELVKNPPEVWSQDAFKNNIRIIDVHAFREQLKEALGGSEEAEG